MSDVARAGAQLGLTIAGGFFFGPVGALAGSLLGQALFAPSLPGVEGPRLQDLTLTRSQVGTPIPWVAGTYVVPGNIIDGEAELTEVSTTERVGGKGGGGQDQTTYAYFGTFALGLGEGPIDGIRRIWADGELIYDARCELAEDETLVTVVERDLAIPGGFFNTGTLRFDQTLSANDVLLEYMTIYLGTEDQDPDPTLEAIHGEGEVPAYRGQAYLMFDGLPLEPFFNRIPQFLVEVARSLPAVPESPALSDDNDGWDILDS
jgi:hypothetical protein